MSTNSGSSKHNRTPYFIIGGLIGCLVLLICVVFGGVGAFLFLAPRAQSAAVTRVPTQSAKQPLLMVTPTPDSNTPPIDYSTYDGTGASFSVQYPSDWDVKDEESSARTVTFISPSQTASANVTYGKLGSVNVQDAFDQILAKVFTDAKIISKRTNPDNSLSAELEHTDPAFGGRVHGYIRLVTSSSTYYIVQFNVLVDDFDQYQNMGKTIVDSLTVSP